MPLSDTPSILALTNTRDRHYPFGIKQADRLSHLYVIGKTGVGKTTLLENMVVQDIAAGRGCALIDPHGDLVERVASRVPSWRSSDVVYVNVPDPAQPYSYNPLSRVSADKRPELAWPPADGSPCHRRTDRCHRDKDRSESPVRP